MAADKTVQLAIPGAARMDARPGDWPTNGGDAAESRFSRLQQIDADNVKDLGLQWTYDLQSSRGVEATPIVVDGTMYVTAPWSIVHAIDARTGAMRWTYDPDVPRSTGAKGCCGPVNRGVAVDKGTVFVATFDGRLVALDAATGKRIWERDTIDDRAHPFTSTGAPRVFKGTVVIGNGGSEFGVRGYVSAYDAKTGTLLWRWYTVPGDPGRPYENAAMAAAAKTWDPASKYWVSGGGGSPWDAFAFDPDLDMLYVGTGNGVPWNNGKRSPNGGDDLYTASIVALDLETGRYVWHYQESPADYSDYDSTNQIVLADITDKGTTRKVLFHAPKNGFFFVLDRTDGRFISAKNFVDVNWASGFEAKGKPILAAPAGDKPLDVLPGQYGGHNWHSMAFDPQTGLVYVPAQHVPMTLMADNDWYYGSNRPGQPMSGLGWNTGMLVDVVPPKSQPFGRLIAWDPLRQMPAWTQDYASPWNGGTLATAGNLVFQGTADGRLVAYNASTGARLWQSPTGTGIVAAPITYSVGGKQYVSVAVGWGGVYGVSQRATDVEGAATVYTFALGGKAPLPAFTRYQMAGLLQGVPYRPADVGPGTLLYISNCVFCHGLPGVDKGGSIKNLGYVAAAEIADLGAIVLDGPFVSQGMPNFTGKLTRDEVTKIQAFIQGTADSIRPPR